MTEKEKYKARLLIKFLVGQYMPPRDLERIRIRTDEGEEWTAEELIFDTLKSLGDKQCGE